jgi:hypothetical protein
MNSDRLPKLNVGDRCWWTGSGSGLVSFVDVTERKEYLEDTEVPFTLYVVKKVIGDHVVDPAHRMDLFKCPEEQDRLQAELYSTMKRCQEYRVELLHREAGYVPDPEKDEI